MAGGTHFGYWYRLNDNPDGPSFTPNFCVKRQPMGKFFNNTVHSVGRFGLWVFPGFQPTKNGGCYDNNVNQQMVAHFDYLTSWRNDKGAEWVMSTNIQFRNMIIFDQSTTGIETKTIASHENYDTSPYYSGFYNGSSGPAIVDSIIIGNSDSSAIASIGLNALIVAWDRGELIKNVTFINYPDNTSYAIGAPIIVCRCT